MQCPECSYALTATFRFCPGCGNRLSTQPGSTAGGKSPETLSNQQKEGKQIQPNQHTDANSSSEHCTEFPGPGVREKVISNPGLTSSQPDTNQDKDGCGSERMCNEISTIRGVPQDGASLSSGKATEENVRLSNDTTSQKTQTSTHVPDRVSFQSHQTPSSDFSSTQVLPGNTRTEDTECSLSSSPEASNQNNVGPDSVKCQLTEEPVEDQVNRSSSKPDLMGNLKTQSATDDFSPPRSDNELQSVQGALSDSATQPQVKDQNDHKSSLGANEATNVVLNSQTQSSTAARLPPSGDWNTEVSNTGSNGAVVKAHAENLTKQSSVPPQPLNHHTTERTKEETHSSGQSEKQQNPTRKLFGPFNNEEGTAAKPKADNVGNKQQTDGKNGNGGKAQKKGNELQKIKEKETPKQGCNTESPLPQEKSVPSHQKDEVGFQEVSSKKKKNNQNYSSNQQQDPKDITIFFHAILSKHFNIDPSRDFVTIRSSGLGGHWGQDILKMEITRDLGPDGYLVHGKIQISKNNVRHCIPYKYVVHKQGRPPEYEHIYTDGSKVIVNRCLSIKEHLLTQQGEWHQYDDIIYPQPTHGLIEMLKNVLGKTKPDLLRGRYIAGLIMLETISDMLYEWSELNVRNFFVQLQQFIRTYSNPVVYEEQPKQWHSLQYGETEVKGLLKDFMQGKIASLQRNPENFFSDQQRTGVILLLVYLKHNLHIDQNTAFVIDWLLCLPKLSKKEFSSYWDAFLQSLQRECDAQQVRTYCRIAQNRKTTTWILVLPMLHFLESASKPYEPNTLYTTGQEFDVWAGLKGLHIPELTDSQYTRALLKVMEKHKYLLDVDQLLARSWMCVLGFKNLPEYTSMIPVDIQDVLVLLNYRFDSKQSSHDKEEMKLLFSDLQNKIKHQQLRYVNFIEPSKSYVKYIRRPRHLKTQHVNFPVRFKLGTF